MEVVVVVIVVVITVESGKHVAISTLVSSFLDRYRSP